MKKRIKCSFPRELQPCERPKYVRRHVDGITAGHLEAIASLAAMHMGGTKFGPGLWSGR